MLCGRCHRQIPDESTFCLGCGTRVAPPERLASPNGGGGGAAPASTAAPVAGGKQAYTLSFRPIADDRLRYRVARWVCEQAPAHALSEVQEGLARGDFFTFLALTAEDLETARRGLQELGVAPALATLAPATLAEMLRPERPQKPARRLRQPVQGRDWLVVVGVLVALLVFGLVMTRMFGGRGF